MFKHMEVRMRTHLIIVVLMVGAIACTDRTAPTSGPLASRLSTGSTPAPTDYGVEVAFRELARVAPSHGGWYVDTLTGDLTVYLKDMTEGPAAKRALALMMSQKLASARARHPHAVIVFKQGTYTFIELARWRDALRSLLAATSSVQWWGIHHSKNQIVVGVLPGADTAAIVAMAQELAIPAGALRFERAGRVQAAKTLQDSIRPVKGGLILQYEESPGCATLLTPSLFVNTHVVGSESEAGIRRGGSVRF